MATLTAYTTNSAPKALDLLLGNKVATPNSYKQSTSNMVVASLATLINTNG